MDEATFSTARARIDAFDRSVFDFTTIAASLRNRGIMLDNCHVTAGEESSIVLPARGFAPCCALFKFHINPERES